MPQYIKNSDNSFFNNYGCGGLVVGAILAFIVYILSGCHEPKPKPIEPKEGRDYIRISTDSEIKAYDDSTQSVRRTELYLDSLDSIKLVGSGTKSNPIRLKGYPATDENMQQVQLDLLHDIKKAINPRMKDTAYRKNIMRIADTFYFAEIHKKKGKVILYFKKEYTDPKYFMHYETIDTLTP